MFVVVPVTATALYVHVKLSPTASVARMQSSVVRSVVLSVRVTPLSGMFPLLVTTIWK